MAIRTQEDMKEEMKKTANRKESTEKLVVEVKNSLEDLSS